MSAYAASVSMQKLFAIFVALSVLFAPAFARAGAAFAAVPDHHAQMIKSGHCQIPPAESGDQQKAPAKNCCVSMCMAVAIAPSTPPSHDEIQGAPAVSTAKAFHLGLPAEIATPPPRSA